jgi:uncharacterized membrane protein HdeD (DUF308 family)
MSKKVTAMSSATFGTAAVARGWWMVLLRGVVSILFGVIAFTRPDIGLLSLVWLYGAYAVADGVTSLAIAFQDRVEHRWWFVLMGLISIAAGAVAFLWPAPTGVVLVMIIGVWAIALGLAEVAAGIALRKEIPDEWVLILSGIVSVLFGGALLYNPGAGAVAMLWLIAGWAIVVGVLLIILSFQLRRLPH